jgi:hypothetical protein
VGCSNFDPPLRPIAAPLVQLLVQESLRRVPHFSMQASAGRRVWHRFSWFHVLYAGLLVPLRSVCEK